MFSKKPACLILALALLAGTGFHPESARAEKYQSRLNSLLIHKASAYLPTRLVLGQQNRFVVKAPAGQQVKVLLSAEGEGYVLPDGTPLRVGEKPQELTGTVPESGVLELLMEMPSEAGLEGKVIYVEAVAGPSEDSLAPVDLVDPTGRRTAENTLVIAKPAEMGGPMVLPGMPGMNTQMFSQLTQMGQIYASKDARKKDLLDTGNINGQRDLDQNPFATRGIQQGLQQQH